MSVVDIRPGHCDDDHSSAAQELVTAFGELPTEHQQAAFEQFVTALVHYESTGEERLSRTSPTASR